MTSWTFIIVTQSGNTDSLSKSITSIRNIRSTSQVEIIVVGGEPINGVRHIPFHEHRLSFKLRNVKNFAITKSLRDLIYRTGAISVKKNLGAIASNNKKLCILHDYVLFSPDWIEKCTDYEWDVLVPRITNSDGKRHRDWVLWNDPIYAETGHPAALPPYNYDSKYYYINGTLIVVDREFFLQNPLNPKLFWGEGEDVEWSCRIRETAKLCKNFYMHASYTKYKYDIPQSLDSWNQNLKIIKKKTGK
jgi:hypothetical protein